MTQTSLPTPGQHIIARRGNTRIEGVVKASLHAFPLITVALPEVDADRVTTTEYDLWERDGWTYEIVPEVSAHVVVDGALA